ncbi:von Willebrand factor A domain-containing protein 5A-like [Erpetoichthys calabaricus]|uniref:von Willebrand factor A domain-containing protein 5A-like n=1 Tax=Erpetoichthys calabaricus TaxID=27687 RepID=A0A8C4X4C7_ERPCA|nr:von Willebrand factor A domain-containing protein 5A-like [Erpetoichthys calabaricus]
MRCGLLTQKKEPVPLKSIAVEISISGFIADVSSTLSYENTESNPVEAVFVFPMEDGSSVYDFHAEIGGKRIEAVIKEKQEARDDYDDAISSGQEAFLLEESDESPDVFSLSVGSLPAGQTASVSLSYVTELPVQADDALRFCLPTVLCPRYTPQGTTSVTTEVPHVPVDSIPYTLSLTCQLVSPNGISDVKSNSALMPLEYLSDDKTEAKVSLSSGFKFDRDVELLIYYNQPHQPMAVVENGQSSTESGSLMGDPVVMISLYPDFSGLTEQSLSTKGEFIFLMDRSGSMDCKMNEDPDSLMRIESARDTLLLLLKSLPFGCFFNIYGFGSHFESFFPESVEYTQQTMESAVEKVKTMRANFGGTEILAPLRDIFGKACKPGYPRQLLVFTDGEVGNTIQVIDEVKKNSSSHRCFTFGIGEGASTALIKGMAKAGTGHFQFVSGKDRMQLKVMQSLRFALQPAVTNISLNWHLPGGMEVAPISETPLVVFNGQRTVLYAQLKGKADENAAGRASLHYTLSDKEYKTEIHFGLKHDKHCRLTAHRLAAKSLMKGMEDKERLGSEGGDENIKKKIIEISTEARVISTHTAFIAINKEKNEAVQGPMVKRRIPLGGFMPMALCSGAPVMMACAMPRRAMAHPCPPPPMLLGRPKMMFKAQCNSITADMPEFVEKKKERIDPLLNLVSLQNADGSWNLEKGLMTLFSKTEKDVLQKMPVEIKDKSVWATFLALLWLHGFNSHQKVEWEFVALKAVSWIKAQTGLNPKLCLQAGNDLLGCQVDLQTLAL